MALAAGVAQSQWAEREKAERALPGQRLRSLPAPDGLLPVVKVQRLPPSESQVSPGLEPAPSSASCYHLCGVCHSPCQPVGWHQGLTEPVALSAWPQDCLHFPSPSQVCPLKTSGSPTPVLTPVHSVLSEAHGDLVSELC